MQEQHSTIREGIVTGAIGATSVALWFLVVDILGGRPLFTPFALGSALFGEYLPGAEITLGPVAAYTVFHYAAFIAVGLLAAASTHLAVRQPVFLALFLILFVVFEIGFYGLVAVLSETVLVRELAWYQIGAGNLLATTLMGGYLWRTHPRIFPGLSHALSH